MCVSWKCQNSSSFQALREWESRRKQQTSNQTNKNKKKGKFEWERGRGLREETERPWVFPSDLITATFGKFWVNWILSIKMSICHFTRAGSFREPCPTKIVLNPDLGYQEKCWRFFEINVTLRVFIVSQYLLSKASNLWLREFAFKFVIKLCGAISYKRVRSWNIWCLTCSHVLLVTALKCVWGM